MIRDAYFSPCGQFRYWFLENWGPGEWLVWVMLNPSQAGRQGADGTIQTDPTATRVRGFSERFGFGGFIIVNLFAYIATSPADLRRAGWPVGPDNSAAIGWMLSACLPRPSPVVCAWGANAAGRSEGPAMIQRIRNAGHRPVCLDTTNEGIPKHPLYLPYSLKLKELT